MKVVTYRGNEMRSILARIRKEYGDEAVILSTHEHGRRDYEIKIGVEAEAETGAEWQAHKSVLNGALSDLGRSFEQPAIASAHDTMLKSACAKTLSGFCESLRSQGLDPSIISELQKRGATRAATDDHIDRLLAEMLATILKVDAKLPDRNKAVALIGSTGVGKTTTIAKLAASLKTAFGLRVALVSADNFRVGAGFQLQTYAALLNMPCRMLDPEQPSAAELRRALDAFANFDVVLIDTAGCNARDGQRIKDLSGIFQEHDQVERLLVLPAPGNQRDLEAAQYGFEPVGYRRVIVSKVDESGYAGPVLNTLIRGRKIPAFITTGQRVPEDIEPASTRRLAWMLTRMLH